MTTIVQMCRQLESKSLSERPRYVDSYLLFIMLAVFYATDIFGEITIITDERTDTTGCNTLPADAFGRKGGGDVVAVRSYTYTRTVMRSLCFL